MMSKPSSGLFKGTSGAIKSNNNNNTYIPSHQKLTNDVKSWAKNKASELAQISKRQRDRFNTATIVYDVKTKKEYWGRNKGIELDKSPKNAILFGDNKRKGILPSKTLNEYIVGNCSEVDAVNKALADMKSDGTYLKISEKWFGTDVSK